MKAIIAFFLLGFILLFNASCQQQNVASTPAETKTAGASATTFGPLKIKYSFEGGCNTDSAYHAPQPQIAEYVRRVYQDKHGSLWFGTNGEGIARHNDDKTPLQYFTTEDGLAGNQITAIMEDKEGKLWIATDGGVTKYDGEKFINYTTKDGLNDNWVWSLFKDSKGTLWAGTLSGLCRFDGTKFHTVALPPSSAKHPTATLSVNRICAITEDTKGNLWFATDGYGAYKYDGKKYTNYTTADGLCDNNVTCITEDKKGNLWFGSMNGGLSKYNGKTFTNYNQSNVIGNNEVWNIYTDNQGFVWFSSEGYGVYRYNGNEFENFGEKQGLGVRAVQTIYQDRKGRIWAGGGGGLYQFMGDGFMNVRKDGPWDGC